MSESTTPLRRPRRNAVYWGDCVALAARTLGLRKDHLRRNATLPNGKPVSGGSIHKLWEGYKGGGAVEEFTAAPIIAFFQKPEFADALTKKGIDPAEILLPQNRRFCAAVRPLLLARFDSFAATVKGLNSDHFSYMSGAMLSRALTQGGCFTKRHMIPLAELAHHEVRKAGWPGGDAFAAPSDLIETVALEDAFPSAYRDPTN